MTNSKATKKALITSVISLLLCVSMLIGSTFAWFTDVATTGINRIVSGNLDVGLRYSMDMESWADAEGTDNIFKKDAVWEPGYTEVVYFEVENKGDLAFNYRIGTNLIKNTLGKTFDGADIDLTKFIKFGIVPVTSAFATREAAVAAITAPTDFSNFFVAENSLDTKGSKATFAMVVFMPATVSNDANHNGVDIPSVEFGIQVVATQKGYESDSFGDDYDNASTYPELAFIKYQADEVLAVKGESFAAAIPAAADLKTESGAEIPANTELVMSVARADVADSNVSVTLGQTAETYEISLKTASGEKVEATGEAITVELFIGEGRTSDIKLYHNATEIAYDSYDAETGIITFKTSDFSPFTIVETWFDASQNEYVISTADELIGFAELVNNGTSFVGKTVKLDADIDLSDALWTPIYAWEGILNGAVIDGQNHTIKGLTVKDEATAGFISNNASKLTIRNLTFDGAYVNTGSGSTRYAGVVIGKDYSGAVLENVTVKNSSVICNWQCGGFVGFAETNAPIFEGCTIENTFVGGYNCTSGAFFGLGAVDISANNCKAINVRLYTDMKPSGDMFAVGYLYGKTLTLTNCILDCTVVTDYD